MLDQDNEESTLILCGTEQATGVYSCAIICCVPSFQVFSLSYWPYVCIYQYGSTALSHSALLCAQGEMMQWMAVLHGEGVSLLQPHCVNSNLKRTLMKVMPQLLEEWKSGVMYQIPCTWDPWSSGTVHREIEENRDKVHGWSQMNCALERRVTLTMALRS